MKPDFWSFVLLFEPSSEEKISNLLWLNGGDVDRNVGVLKLTLIAKNEKILNQRTKYIINQIKNTDPKGRFVGVDRKNY